jgi:hypothetical protein
VNRRRLFLTALASALLAFSAPAHAQTGRIGYLKGDAAYVQNADGSGMPIRLPGSDHAVAVALSPADGTALYFVAARPVGVFEAEVARGVACPPPYKEATFLTGAPWSSSYAANLLWLPNGEAAFLTSDDAKGGRYTPADGRALPYPVPVASASADGSVVAYGRDGQVRVRFRATGKEKVIFSADRPQPLFDAIRRAKNPKNLEVLRTPDPELYRRKTNWAIGTPALTPDGKTIFFAANAGGGMGAAGNTNWALFTADVATGKLAILSRFGEQGGRVPYSVCQVSPDGRRLLLSWSFHVSALEAPSSLVVIDLPTQKASRDYLDDPARKNLTDSLRGACWSPDGKYFAYAAAFYSAETENKKAQAASDAGTQYPGPDSAGFKVYIRDTATGRLVRTIEGAREPSWAR